jgi:hypothetical protein
MKYDAVICAGPHHLQIAAVSIKSLQIFSRPDKIYMITAADNFERFQTLEGQGSPLVMVDEDKLIQGVDLGSLKEYFVRRGADPARTGWYFQQFLKMSICHLPTLADHFLIWDSDTIMLRPLSFFDPDGRPLVNPTSRFHRPYFDLIERLFGFTRLVDFSFISEHLMIRKEYMQQLIDEIQSRGSKVHWTFHILDLVKDADLSKAGFSEFETYGNFVQRKYPGSYLIRRLRSLRSGAKRTGPVPGARDLYLFSRKYAYVSFEVWTKPLRWKALSWKWETSIYHAAVSIGAFFSKRVARRMEMISQIFR